jgi:hypothetical protein
MAQSNSVIKARAEFKIQQGDTFNRTWEFKDEAGEYIDMDGKQLQFEVFDVNGATILTIPDGSFNEVVPGKYVTNVTATATDALTPGAYFWRLRVTYATTEVRTWGAGQFIIESKFTA